MDQPFVAEPSNLDFGVFVCLVQIFIVCKGIQQKLLLFQQVFVHDFPSLILEILFLYF
jgi:hypothetical protein